MAFFAVFGSRQVPIYALKCDILKFFDSIDHEILLELITEVVRDPAARDLLRTIVESFAVLPGKGLPLGNVTSQIFANMYLNELDRFVKDALKIRFYLRYCDDFILLDTNRDRLAARIPLISQFLQERLRLSLHPRKVEIRPFHRGVDFLGYAVLPGYCVLRTKTKRRMVRKISLMRQALQDGLITEEFFRQSLNSYLGMLTHCKGYKLGLAIEKIILSA